MVIRLSLSVTAAIGLGTSVVLAAEPGQGRQASDAQAFSAAAGRILGAATACDQISEDRVSADATRTIKIITAAAIDEQDDASARALFIDSAGEGQQAVDNGSTECGAVDASLAQLEQIVQGAQDRLNEQDDSGGDDDPGP